MLFFITLFLPNFVNKKSSQTGACASTQSVDELKALNIVAALHLPPGHVSDGLHQGGPVGVETLGPVVSSPGLDRKVYLTSTSPPSSIIIIINITIKLKFNYLTKHKVLRSEYSAHPSSLDTVLQIRYFVL